MKGMKSVPAGLAEVGTVFFLPCMLSSHAATKMEKALDVKEAVEVCSCCIEVTEEGNLKVKMVD